MLSGFMSFLNKLKGQIIDVLLQTIDVFYTIETLLLHFYAWTEDGGAEGGGGTSRPRHSSRQLTFDSEKDKREFFGKLGKGTKMRLLKMTKKFAL